MRSSRRSARAVGERDPLLLWSRISPFWEALRQHPEFDRVVRPVWG